MSPDDREVLRQWLAAFEPAADISVLPNEVVARSLRRQNSVRVPRTKDLESDLRNAVAKLVDSMG